MQLLSLALKNVLRYRHRTWVTVLAMAFAGAIMIFYAGLFEGWMGAMETNAVSMEMGEMQIHAQGYRDDPDLYTVIPDYRRVIRQAENSGLIASPRLLGGGLAAAHENSTGVSIRGIDPRAEEQVVLLQNHVFSGSWLSATDAKQVVLGYQLARILDVRPGSEIVLVAQAADGSMANDLFTVQGVLKSVGQGIDRGGLIMGDRDFREFFALPEGVHEIVMKRADNGVLLEQATKKIAELVPDLEVNSWRELQPTLARLLDLSDVSMIIMLLIIYAAVGMLTMNAMLMGVFERIPVFGVMKAVGFSGCRLFGLIFSETLLLVTMAAVLSLALGVPLSYYFERHPIDFSFLLPESSTIAGIAFEPQWYCRVTAGSVVMPVVFLYIVALLAVLYPAWKAAVISPVKAIHHI
ncbi:MAG: FtsX-like permease family protein [Desulfobulbaceae bacterium]|nr:FtsX-like permease family protein [Desulfobulbaceae bacterium]